MQNKIDGLPAYVPEQVTGKASDVIGEDVYASEALARVAFRRTRAHMLDVNRWNHLAESPHTRPIAGPLLPSFRLVGKSRGSAAVGDLIEISAGGQSMFVRIERIVDQADEFAIRVRACQPDGGCNSSQHMYAPYATTTFRLTLRGNTLVTGFHGRNEVVNTGLVNRVADLSMSLGGREFSWGTLGAAWRPDPQAMLAA